MRIEHIGRATLYLGDCRDILPTLNGVDTILTDPPYGTEGLVGGYSRDGATILGDTDLSACQGSLEALLGWPQSLWVLVFYSCRITPSFFEAVPDSLEYFGELIWNKKLPGMGQSIRYQHENVAVFKYGSPPPMSNIFSVLSIPRIADEHPHQKPVAVLKHCLRAVGGLTVCDPFMGSGSTGVAAVEQGRKFIGIELDPAHFDTACRRLEQANTQHDLFEMPQEQGAML